MSSSALLPVACHLLWDIDKPQRQDCPSHFISSTATKLHEMPLCPWYHTRLLMSNPSRYSHSPIYDFASFWQHHRSKACLLWSMYSHESCTSENIAMQIKATMSQQVTQRYYNNHSNYRRAEANADGCQEMEGSWYIRPFPYGYSSLLPGQPSHSPRCCTNLSPLLLVAFRFSVLKKNMPLLAEISDREEWNFTYLFLKHFHAPLKEEKRPLMGQKFFSNWK